MRFWRGWGILVIAIVLPFVVVVQGACVLYTRDPHFNQNHEWPLGLALMLAAAPIYLIGRKLNPPPRQVLFDRYGREVAVRSRHSLFTIAFENWAYLLAALGFLLITVPLFD